MNKIISITNNDFHYELTHTNDFVPVSHNGCQCELWSIAIVKNGLRKDLNLFYEICDYDDNDFASPFIKDLEILNAPASFDGDFAKLETLCDSYTIEHNGTEHWLSILNKNLIENDTENGRIVNAK